MGIQSSRPFAFHCSLGDEVLWVRRFRGTESLGACFEFSVDLLSNDPEVDIDAILGLNASLRIGLGDRGARYIDGIVTEMSFVGVEGRHFLYRVVLRPWLWLLTKSVDCRFFQDKNAIEIVKEVFRSHGFSDFEERLTQTFRVREHCVQYRESDFAFVSRLLEEEGVYYYFRHEQGKHVLVLMDPDGAHDPAPNLAEIPFSAEVTEGKSKLGHFSHWRLNRSIQSGKCTLSDYNFTMPSANLTANASLPNGHAEATHEVFDYPGRYTTHDEGSQYARVRMQALNAQHETVQGTCDARSLPCGATFKLVGHPRSDQNKQYLTMHMQYEVEGPAFESVKADGDLVYRVYVTALDSTRPFRPTRATPKALVPGPQTAVVVGSGAVWTDEHARVKVQFHWDRDAKQSCWVRVSQSWASASFGSMHLPHIGDEVVVSFLEGDPDRPLITGRVYNGTNRVWRPLPAENTKSYFRDMGGNHIYMDERKGAERIELFSPFANTKLSLGAPASPPGINMCTDENMTQTIQGDSTQSVQGNKSTSVQGNTDSKVQGTSSSHVQGDVTDVCGANKTQEVKGNTKSSIGGDLLNTILGKTEETKVGPLTVTNKGFRAELTIGATKEVFVGAKWESSLAVKVETSAAIKIEKNKVKTLFEGPNKEDDVKARYQMKAGTAEIATRAGPIQLKAGSTKILISKDGGIVISAKGQVFIKSDSTATVSGSSKVILKAPQVKACKGKFESKNMKDLG